MARQKSTAVLAQQIRRLIEERQKHTDAIQSIDQTLGQIRSLLAGGNGTHTAARGGGAGGGAGAKAGAKRGRRRRGRFDVTAEQFVLDLVKGKRNATTQEINAAWKSQGRGGTADNTLTKLVKEKKLKRKSIEGQRGSRYEAA